MAVRLVCERATAARASQPASSVPAGGGLAVGHADFAASAATGGAAAQAPSPPTSVLMLTADRSAADALREAAAGGAAAPRRTGAADVAPAHMAACNVSRRHYRQRRGRSAASGYSSQRDCGSRR